MGAFAQQLQIGQQHEKRVLAILRSREVYVIPNCDIANGGAPKLLGPYGQAIVLPDFNAYKNAKSYPFEVKAKTEATHTHMLDIFEHGFSIRLYEQYLAFQKATGMCIVIAVDEEKTGEVLMRSLNQLGQPRYYRGDKMGPSGMVFFPRDRFFVFHQGPPRDLPLFTAAGIPIEPTLPKRDLDDLDV